MTGMATAAAITAMAISGFQMNKISPMTTPMRPYLMCGVIPGSLRGPVPLLTQLSHLAGSSRSTAAGPGPGCRRASGLGPPLASATDRSRFLGTGQMVDDDTHDAFPPGRRRRERAPLPQSPGAADRHAAGSAGAAREGVQLPL